MPPENANRRGTPEFLSTIRDLHGSTSNRQIPSALRKTASTSLVCRGVPATSSRAIRYNCSHNDSRSSAGIRLDDALAGARASKVPSKTEAHTPSSPPQPATASRHCPTSLGDSTLYLEFVISASR